MDDFPGFGAYGFENINLPSNATLYGRGLGERYVPLEVDGGGRLVVLTSGPILLPRLPVAVPSGAAGMLEVGVSGEGRYLVGLDVVNTTANPVTLKLYYFMVDVAPPDAFVFATGGETIAAGGVFSWRGNLRLESGGALWGLAGAATALYAHCQVRRDFGAVRVS